MDGIVSAAVTGVEELATLYAPLSERVLRKEIGYVDAVGRAFIAASPFLVLATGSSKGLDCSPKGDKPGFVQVADDGGILLIPDRRGKNRIDSLKNLVEDPTNRTDLPGSWRERDLPGQWPGTDQLRSEFASALGGRRKGAADRDRGDCRAGVPALSEGAGAFRSVEGRRRKAAARRPDARQFRRGAQSGDRS